MDILRDSIWQFVGVVIAIIALVISIILFFKQWRKRELVYEVKSNTSILREDTGDVKLLFKGKQVENAYITTLKIMNRGKASIRSEDFENNSPIVIDFGQEAEILTAEVTSTIPKSIVSRVHLEHKSGQILLKPLLLNHNDTIEIKVLYLGTDDAIEVYGNIYEVQEIKSLDSFHDFKNYEVTSFSLFLLVFFGFSDLICFCAYEILISALSSRLPNFSIFKLRIDVYSIFTFIVYTILLIIIIIYSFFNSHMMRFVNKIGFLKWLVKNFWGPI